MRPLFNTPEAMARMRAHWRRPDTDIGDTYKVKEFLNGGLVVHNNSVSAIPCYVRLIQSRYEDYADFRVEVELINQSENIAEQVEFERETVEVVKARLRLWGVPYTVHDNTSKEMRDCNNVFITYQFQDQLNGGADICGTDTTAL